MIAVPAELLDRALEAADATIERDAETVAVGPFGDVTYYRVSAPDLVVAVDEARRLLDEIEAAVLDARQDKIDAERHQCAFCSTLIDGDMETCGHSVCDRRLAAERYYDALGLI